MHPTDVLSIELLQWRACFISWCANRAGLLKISGQLVLVPKSVAVAQYPSFYQAENRFRDKSIYTPKRGDIFINKSNGASHVGIVTGYDPSTKMFTKIEEISLMIRSKSFQDQLQLPA